MGKWMKKDNNDLKDANKDIVSIKLCSPLPIPCPIPIPNFSLLYYFISVSVSGTVSVTGSFIFECNAEIKKPLRKSLRGLK